MSKNPKDNVAKATTTRINAAVPPNISEETREDASGGCEISFSSFIRASAAGEIQDKISR